MYLLHSRSSCDTRSVAKPVPKANRGGKSSLCENLASHSRQTGRNSECSKLWSEAAFRVQVRAQPWQIRCLDDISPAGCGQTTAARAGQPQRGFCLLPGICTRGGAGGSHRPCPGLRRQHGYIPASASTPPQVQRNVSQSKWVSLRVR